MIKKNHSITINLPGGIVSAGDFSSIMTAAEQARIPEVQFGTRQQMILKVQDAFLPPFQKAVESIGLPFGMKGAESPNIVSSYVTENVFSNSGWLSEGVYKDILESFDYKPTLKINIVDCDQTFVPFFTGNINFISSSVGNYWFLYVRFPKSRTIYRWRHLVYTQDIPRISALIEEAILSFPRSSGHQLADINLLYHLVNAKQEFLYGEIVDELKVPEFTLPYYEGFNRYENKTWLGIYRRDESFDVQFLRDISMICRQTRVGQLYVTPWKSLVIKGIEQQDRKYWDHALGKYRINVRHASNELNWQVEDNCEEGLNLKRYLIRQFDKEDVRTFGLSFAIKTQPHSGLFGSIVIRKQLNESANQRKFLDRYDILYAENFNPNSKELVLFRKNIEKENLGVYLISLCKYFYSIQSREEPAARENFIAEHQQISQAQEAIIEAFQCRHCYTIYDGEYGDEYNKVAPGTSFGQLPENYECPTCGALKENFARMEKSPFLYS